MKIIINIFFFIPTGGKNFFANYELKRHIAHTHNQSKEYKCDQCDKAYGYSHLLKRHISEVHEEINIKHPCDKCDKVWNFTIFILKIIFCTFEKHPKKSKLDFYQF